MIILQIAIAVFVLFLVFGIIVLVLDRNRDDKKKSHKNTIISVASIAITMFGIVLAIADDYFSQYDYNKNTIRDYIGYRKKGISFDSYMSNRKPINPPEYVFVLDVSEYTKLFSVEMSSAIQEKINAINLFGRLDTEIETFGVNSKNTIRLCDLLKVRLLYSLIQLNNMYDTLDYTIIFFSDQCRMEDHTQGKTLSDCIEISFKNVIGTECDGRNSDFVRFFDCINKDVLRAPFMRNHFEQKEVHIVFLSDCFKDVPDEKKLEKSIKQLEAANLYFDIIMIADSLRIINNDVKYNSLQKSLSESSIKYIDDIESVHNLFDMTLPTPLPFFYSNSIFEDSLNTAIMFDCKQDLVFYLQNYSDSDRRKYILYENGGGTHRLSDNKKNHIRVRKNEKINIKFFGYIPAPYTYPDIIIEEPARGFKYVIPIVFFKEYPRSVLWISVIIIVILIIGIISLAICCKSKKRIQQREKVEKVNCRMLNVVFK